MLSNKHQPQGLVFEFDPKIKSQKSAFEKGADHDDIVSKSFHKFFVSNRGRIVNYPSFKFPFARIVSKDGVS